MTPALRLHGAADPERDEASLHCLLSVWPAAWHAGWVRWRSAEGIWLTSPDLAQHAAALQALGTQLEEVPADATPIEAPTLAAALPVTSIVGGAPGEALFLVPVGEAHATVTRLLRLDRPDVSVADWFDPAGQRWLALRVPDPPLYLLMRARESDEGVRAFTRLAERHVFVAWGSAHPLADRLTAPADGAVLIDADSTWQIATWPTDWRPLASRVDAALDAPRIDLQPATGVPPRFTVPLRLEEARPASGTLWLLNATAFADLAPIIETSSPEALRAVRVSRLVEGAQVRYLIRTRNADDPVGGRIADLLGERGFTHAPGAERIFVPAGMRLAPAMRLDALRAVLSPPSDGLVLVDQTPDGPTVRRIGAVNASPLSAWIDYLALDNRVVLDAILEESIFAVSQLVLDRPTRTVSRKAPKPPQPRRKKRRRIVEQPVEGVESEAAELDADTQALQREAAELEARILEGGCADPAVLGRMGELQVALGAVSDAAWCFEAAAFHAQGAARQRWLTPLLGLRRKQVGRDDTPDALLIEAVSAAEPTSPTIGLLGADTCVRLLQGTPLLDGLRPAVLETFSNPLLPATRRLNWLTLFELAAATADRLGATRAKEHLFGSLNTAGLRDLFDAPGFVRLALALSEDDAGNRADAQTVQSASLEMVWSQFAPGHGELDVQALLYKAIFAVGFARLGEGGQARRLAEAVTEELPVHDPPAAALARLYLARIATTGGDDDEARWASAVQQVEAGLWDRGHQRVLQFTRKRSLWLADPAAPRKQPSLRREVRTAIDALSDAARAPSVLDHIGRMRAAYDYEVVESITAAVNAALGSGREALISQTLTGARRLAESLRLPAQRLRAIGAVITGEALIDDEHAVDASLLALGRLIPNIDNVLTLRPTIGAVLSALRRVDASSHAAHLFSELEDFAGRGHREAARLLGLVADGYRLLGHADRAKLLLEQAIDAIFAADIEHGIRFEAAATLLDLLRAWPSEVRERVARRVLDGIDRFRDGFTSRRFYEVLKVMCVERIVDTLADTQSHGTGRIRAWLEREEQAVRRQILTDWRSL